MSTSLEILEGAFTAELVKGQWKYTPNVDKINQKPKEEKKESLKEKPQYPVIEKYEEASIKRFQGTLRDTTLEITKYLKEIAKV